MLADRIGRPGAKLCHQRISVGRNLGHIEPGLSHGLQHFDRAGRCIESHAIGDTSVAVRIIGENDRDLALPRLSAPEPRPVGRQPRDEGHATMIRGVSDDIGLDRLVVARGRLETDGAGEHPSVHFRQRHIHRQIARVEPLRRGFPDRATDGREDRLKHRRAGCFQHRALRFTSGCGDRKSGRIDHHVRLHLTEDRADDILRHLILEAGDEDR